MDDCDEEKIKKLRNQNLVRLRRVLSLWYTIVVSFPVQPIKAF